MKKGIYNIHKPIGPTSNDIIMKIKRLTGEKKVGHAGTLDPLAEGVLVVAIGREFTKQLNEQVEKEKEYIAEIKLGETSTTDDEEGEKEITEVKKKPTTKEIKKAAKKFIGEIKQIPPKYSAGKVSGKEAYKKVRAGEKFNLGPHSVVIKEIEILSYDWPILKVKVTTGMGVYIRSLARDIGEELKTGGYLTSLVRTRVGEHKIENAITIYSPI